MGDLRRNGVQAFWPTDLSHVYLKLEFDHDHENAATADCAAGFLRSVDRAAIAAQDLAEIRQGFLLEVQGSMLHVALPPGREDTFSYAAELNAVLHRVFHDSQKRVRRWYMSTDEGRTLVVPGLGVHGDESYVSLGTSANEPAKYLYSSLEPPLDKRKIQPFHIAMRNPNSKAWQHLDLDAQPEYLSERTKRIIAEVREAKPDVRYLGVADMRGVIRSQALPIGTPGSSGSPTAERPQTYFGWVMRADLDGFTKRVDSCFGDAQELMKLAIEFRQIMDAAAEFVRLNGEEMAQMPWAGDNFTAAIVFPNKDNYDEAAPRRLVDCTLDFEKEMELAAVSAGFGGWAHGVAGGTVHGNTNGNVYIAGVMAGGRRFLVGAGVGFGRSTGAFAEIDPKSGELALFSEDSARLCDEYRKHFLGAANQAGEQSTLYRVADTKSLRGVRSRGDSKAAVTILTHRAEAREIHSRPHFK